MGADGGDSGATYSYPVAFIFTFNLIVGAGALALPLAFKAAGLVLGTLFLALLCFLAYITMTFVVEALAIANAFASELAAKYPEEVERRALIAPASDVSKSLALNEVQRPEFAIVERIELAKVASLLLGPVGHGLFCAVIIVYLYGDVAIYASAVPASLLAVTPAQGWAHLSAENAYWVYLGVFLVLLTPLCFFDFQRTRFLQYATMAVRNIALLTMIVLASVYDEEGHGRPPESWLNLTGFPALFGAAIYGFMCHHSLPSIVTPLNRPTRRVYAMLALDSTAVLLTYVGLCWSAVWAYGAVSNPKCLPEPGPPCALQQLYSQNWASFAWRPLAVFLVLFPVFTLSSNFPMIVITLRNTLMQLITWRSDTSYPTLRRVLFTFLALLPPLIPVFVRAELSVLVSITGGFAGLFIMFFFPSLFVFFGRRKSSERWGVHVSNPLQSPFASSLWVFALWLWCAFALAGQLYRQVMLLISIFH